MNFKLQFAALLLLFVTSCSQKEATVPFQNQGYFFSNIEGNNQIEGQHIFISKQRGDTLFFDTSCKKVLGAIGKKWIIGQGSGKAYYDAGKEKTWAILEILPNHNAIRFFGSNIEIKQPVVFWNKGYTPMEFDKTLKGSWGFSKIIRDPKNQKFYTHLYNCDTDQVSIYLSKSENLSTWETKKVLDPEQFKNTPWNVANADGKMKVTPLLSDIILKDSVYYCFAYGDDADEKTYIGLLKTTNLKEYEIINQPILSPNPTSDFSNNDVYYPKVLQVNNDYLMFYTAKNQRNEEFISVAQSKDLVQWSVLKENIVPRNTGWNAALYNQLTAQVELHGDSIILWATGAKEVGELAKPNKGNPLDLCIGIFKAHKDSLLFHENPGNPVFGGNPTLDSENDHIGGAFQTIQFNNYNYTFYHGKGLNTNNYRILIR